MKFIELRNLVSEARSEARNQAESCAAVVQSRGAWISALRDGETITESGDRMFTTLKALKADVAALKAMGADKFFIDGGFDGADTLADMLDGCADPYVSEWSIELPAEFID